MPPVSPVLSFWCSLFGGIAGVVSQSLVGIKAFEMDDGRALIGIELCPQSCTGALTPTVQSVTLLGNKVIAEETP